MSLRKYAALLAVALSLFADPLVSWAQALQTIDRTIIDRAPIGALQDVGVSGAGPDRGDRSRATLPRPGRAS